MISFLKCAKSSPFTLFTLFFYSQKRGLLKKDILILQIIFTTQQNCVTDSLPAVLLCLIIQFIPTWPTCRNQIVNNPLFFFNLSSRLHSNGYYSTFYAQRQWLVSHSQLLLARVKSFAGVTERRIYASLRAEAKCAHVWFKIKTKKGNSPISVTRTTK